ncbi:MULTISPECIES: GntR family transcriptional regulator [unclassified Frigoribacterium]|uniref:GntR family transcriptional regulator n=1 Tax=unclassified Frigoribacterium TaxID=2627005 RepID=UPI001B72105C|nr:GntR family transcriptional regulator [Frigoribacterium sp. PvP121]MBP1240235.1 DNA-binding GntR family transcriptional regulator [Frigoribacterium sp. PvP121]
MPVPTTTTMRIPRRLHRDEVYDRLLEAILDGTFEPAERIRDHDLSAWLCVSRTPIRMALARLGDLGLVETTSNRMTRIAPARPELLADLVRTTWGLWALADADVAAAEPVGRAGLLRALEAGEARCREVRADAPEAAAAVTTTLCEVGAALAAFSANRSLGAVLEHLGLLLRHHSSRAPGEADAGRLVPGLSAARGAVEAGELGAWGAALERLDDRAVASLAA